jgi:hypothetical protein
MSFRLLLARRRSLILGFFFATTQAATAQPYFRKCAQEVGLQMNAFGQVYLRPQNETKFNDCLAREASALSRTRVRSSSPSAVSTPPRTSGHAHLPSSHSRTMVSGQLLRLAHFAAVNPDCSPAGATHVRIVGQPRNGRLSQGRATDFTSGFHGAYAACNSQRVAGTTVSYIARKGYAGPDAAKLLVVYPSGNTRQVSFVINVVP